MMSIVVPASPKIWANILVDSVPSLYLYRRTTSGITLAHKRETSAYIAFPVSTTFDFAKSTYALHVFVASAILLIYLMVLAVTVPRHNKV